LLELFGEQLDFTLSLDVELGYLEFNERHADLRVFVCESLRVEVSGVCVHVVAFLCDTLHNGTGENECVCTCKSVEHTRRQ
jgi:hypothetical protein